MRVFLSWSGDRSRAVADLLNDWIKCVLQAANPWMSSKHIDRGSLWFSEISDQLENTKIGIVCLTKENQNKPWILFEAGALAKGLSSSRVCTFLIDMESTDVSGPLAQFNHTSPNKEGVFELVKTLNRSLNEKALSEQVLKKVFETYWPEFKREFDQVIKTTPYRDPEPARSEESMIQEILKTVRIMDKRIRDTEHPKNDWKESGMSLKDVAQRYDDMNNAKIDLANTKRDRLLIDILARAGNPAPIIVPEDHED